MMKRIGVVLLLIVVTGIVWKLIFADKQVKETLHLSKESLVKAIERNNKNMVLSALNTIGEGQLSTEEISLIQSMWKSVPNIFSSEAVSFISHPDIRVVVARLISQGFFNKEAIAVKKEDVHAYIQKVMAHNAKESILEPAIISLRYYNKSEDVKLLERFLNNNNTNDRLYLLAVESLLFMCNKKAIERVRFLPKDVDWLVKKVNAFKLRTHWCRQAR